MIIEPVALSEWKSRIGAVVFDFGGVLLELHPDRTFERLSSLTGLRMEEDQIPSDLLEVFTQFEKGLTRVENLMWTLQNVSKTKPHPRPLIDAWNAMLGGWKSEKLDFLAKNPQKHKTYLLSNTNEIHLDWVRRDLQSVHGISGFEERFFADVFYSHIIHYRKPETEIFDFVAGKIGLQPPEILFIDDSLANVEAASAEGWTCLHHERNSSLDYMVEFLNA